LPNSFIGVWRKETEFNMIRACKLTGKWYATEIDIDEDTDNIQSFVDTGSIVVIGNDIDSIREFVNDDVEFVK
jgi:hypothetical protein